MDIQAFLEERVSRYHQPAFIQDDPVSIPHLFSKKQDKEIAGFFAAILAWGNRKTIIRNATKLMELMDNAPYDFCLHHKEKELRPLEAFCHRTFNATDLLYFVSFLQAHYSKFSSLEDAFVPCSTRKGEIDMEEILNHFHTCFFSLEHVPQRTKKHVAAPYKNSACKRLNMFLRWMVRNDKKGVDFGMWKRITPAQLICPLDVHVSRVAKKLGLLHRKQTDWKAALQLTDQLKIFDPHDPVRFDYALFGLGVYEHY